MTDHDRKILAEQIQATAEAARALANRIGAMQEALAKLDQDQQAHQAHDSLTDAWQDVTSCHMRLRTLARRISPR
jgi:dihydroxyacid dehydratase/phosphogluconate dehydratase